MLEKLGEWYRIVTPNPRHEDLEKRKTSVESLVSTLKAKSKTLIPEAVAGLAWRFDSDMEVVSTLTDAIRAQDLSFPTHIEGNELELKVVAALALGEIMNSSRSSKVRRLAAAFVISAFGIPRDIHSQTQHFAEMLESLHNVATDVVDQDAEAIRRVSSLSAQSIDISQQFNEMDEAAHSNNAPNQPLQLWLAVAPVLRQTLDSFQKRLKALELAQRADREELEVLWWSYSGCSRITGELFCQTNAGVAALCAGRELADICLVPPLPNARHLLADVVSRGRKNASQEIPLESIVAEWSEPILIDGTQYNSDVAQESTKKYPALLPVSWITRRLVESKMSADWTDEFETMTGIKKDVALSVAQWAEQVLWEHVAERVYEA